MLTMESIKDKNKAVIAQIESLVKMQSNNCSTVEILLEYINNNGNVEHQVGHYFVNSSGHVIGTIGNVFDFDFYNLREITNFWQLGAVFDILETYGFLEDYEDDPDEDDITIEVLDCSAEDIKVGDYMYLDGPSSFCDGYYMQIERISTKYDTDTGEPYRVFIDEDCDWYDSRTGACISNENSMYGIEHYGRRRI